MRYVSSPLFKFVVIGTFAGLFASNLGCRKLVSKALQQIDGGTSTTGTSEAQSNDPDERLREKIEPYIECLNSLSSEIRGMEKSYLSNIPGTGPTGKERSAYMPALSKGDATKCSTNLAKAKTMQPSLPALEQAGEAFAKAANQIDPLAAQLHEYFDKKNYLDDHWAKAKELHPQIMAAFKDFNRANDDLHTALDGITKPLSQRELARIEKEDGKKFRYHRKHVLNTARDLVEVSNPDSQEIDFNAYSAAMTEFEKALEDLTTYGGSHKSDLSDEKKRVNVLAEHNYDSFVRAANDYQKAQKTFWRCLRDAPAKAKLANGRVDVDKAACPKDVINGRADQAAMKKYNEFINTSNRSQF
ncbi:MAG: YiiG family protein [Polyangiaceae bacterium]|nr:YiiG family protein [Polyangiaceae bacterium]